MTGKIKEMSKMKYDVFIAHASEDKMDFVEPLAKALKEVGLEVWYDDFILGIGDKIGREIDKGLANSRYGIVVLSKAFFEKEWPQSELDALQIRENREGRKVILPVWYQIDREEVEKQSPLLASSYAAKSSDGLDEVVKGLVKACRESIDEKVGDFFETTRIFGPRGLLSYHGIQTALDEGRLVIQPEPLPREHGLDVKYCPYDMNSVDLKLHNEIIVPEFEGFAIDLERPDSIAHTLTKCSKRYTITKEQPYLLTPGSLILGRTLEWIELSIEKDLPYLAGRIQGKRGRMRLGLVINFGATFIHPGFKGALTLEIINLGPVSLLLGSEMPIAELFIEQVN